MNINARAANIQSQQTSQLNAAGNVNLTEGLATRSFTDAQFASTKGFMSSRSRASLTTQDSTQSIGTNVGGANVNVNTDAHSTADLALYRFGVDVARRGWLGKDDVFNTRSLPEVMRELERRKK